MGRTAGEGVAVPFRIKDRSDVPVTNDTAGDGAMDGGGQVLGTYIHGLFHNGGLRRAMLLELARRKGATLPPAAAEMAMEAEFDKLAAWVRASLQMDAIYRMTGLEPDFGN